ncbi:hypothetical protein [uncultured Sphingomonas sp.]|uniref:hypothetical protein n=1 Tax=uncultured Sphingomonas sp. TaxID=158754 RepID=UPI0025F774CD|nr:hypothetical protein [uncultured Sphingomonas sp.]
MVATGLMKRDGERLVFRNTLYEAIARSSPQLQPEVAQDQGGQHLVAVTEAAFSFMADSQFREIAAAAHDGAASAYNQGHFRLGLIGFGVCLEAMLIDWLVRQNAGLAAAVEVAKNARPPDKANFDQRYEIEGDPSTWRLINLMKVSRVMGGVRGPMSLPDSLRDMRNFVHPKLMKENYMQESALEPEARGASALISAVKRDLTP